MADDRLPGPSLCGIWHPLLTAGLDVARSTHGAFNREVRMLSSSFELSEPAPGGHQEHQGRAKRSQEASVPLNAQQTPISLSCEFFGLYNMFLSCCVGMLG